MSEINNKKRPLYIPVKTLDSDDFIEGVGKLELALISASVLGGIVLGMTVSAFTNGLIGVLTAIVISILAIGIFKRDNTNENVIRKLSIIYRFLHRQRRYVYQYYSVLEHMDISEEGDEHH